MLTKFFHDRTNRLKNSEGFTLVEMLIAMGMLGIFSLIFSTVVINMSKEKAQEQRFADLTELELELVRSLSFSNFCSCNFGWLRIPTATFNNPNGMRALNDAAQDPRMAFDLDANTPNPYRLLNFPSGALCANPTLPPVAELGKVIPGAPGSPEVSQIRIINAQKISNNKMKFDLKIAFAKQDGQKSSRAIQIKRIYANMVDAGTDKQLVSCDMVKVVNSFSNTHPVTYVGDPLIDQNYFGYGASNWALTTMTGATPVKAAEAGELILNLNGSLTWSNAGDYLSTECPVGYYFQEVIYSFISIEVTNDGGNNWTVLNPDYFLQPTLYGGSNFTIGVRRDVAAGETLSYRVRIRGVQMTPFGAPDCISNLDLNGSMSVTLRPLN